MIMAVVVKPAPFNSFAFFMRVSWSTLGAKSEDAEEDESEEEEEDEENEDEDDDEDMMKKKQVNQ